MTMEKRGETKQLSLQQKVVQIRKRIPALVKKAYSEEVSYDFVKIDDVYRHLAPAMNDYQVNLEVISESATRKDEQGNPLFVQYVPQCQMWMYEADLTLRWINAEEAQEADTVVIHAIGSHEFPDKAKGSAWTYALKYYLLNKFCIDQGGEDPDMRGLKTPEMESEENGRFDLDTPFSFDETKSSDSSEPESPEAESTGMSELEPPETKPTDKPRAEKKAAKDSEKQFRSQEPETKPQGKTEVSGKPEAAEKRQPAQGRNQKEESLNQTADAPKQSAPPVSSHIKPESGTMVQLPESAKEELESGSGMTIEEAMQIKCTPGTYSEHTLGSLAQMGEEGINALIWYAEGYRGRRQELREGAKLLLNAAKAA
ncbi:MAG: hypothetical protein E7244_05895 [Enterocloster citroniae]|nr:hypothetical protein [Enterocloster citroniae]